jgi:hypothetical protein
MVLFSSVFTLKVPDLIQVVQRCSQRNDQQRDVQTKVGTSSRIRRYVRHLVFVDP